MTPQAINTASPKWTLEQIELALKLYPDQSIPIDEICARVGRSAKAIRHQANKVGIKRRSEGIAEPVAPVTPTRTGAGFWTDERDAELRRLASIGCGDREIASRLGDGCTKNMVISRRHKLGVELTWLAPHTRRPLIDVALVSKIAPNPPRKPKETPKQKSAPLSAPEVVAMPQPALQPIEHLFTAPMPNVDAPTGAGAAIMALRHDSCRWPISDPLSEDFHFCCDKAIIGGSYCPEHTMRSQGLGTRSEQKAIKSALKVA